MMSSAEGTGAQRMPAWKRLGLKLKQPTASEPANGGAPPAVGHPSRAQQSSDSTKRKFDAQPVPDSSLDIKRPRRERQPEDRNAPLKQKPKSVSFGDTPTKDGKPGRAASDSNKPANHKPQQQVKKSKGPAKKQKPVAPTDLKPALEYLQLWKTSRDSWKFNKNHQSTLIKHVFDADGIPAADIDAFYEYIRDLKGFVRTRLRETAMEVRNKDVADGVSGFPAGTSDVEAKQVSYEKLLADLLQKRTSSQKRKDFDEANYVASSTDINVVISRVVKRMRAELILDELSDGEQTDDSRTTQSSNTVASSDTNPAPSTDKKVRLNDGTSKRRRKLRVNVDESSSSESEPGSGSDTSSDSSSDESDESDEDADADAANGYESSDSSSSSSSSSAGESDSDSDSDEDEDEDDE
ncbi:hypothetical protein HIM_02143 [Hirsutella minnesotensis 3608]|nr:hypothetical protein HIM_02143 [Hirsutella minnesotensis 3608]